MRNHYNQQELQRHFARLERKHWKLTLVDLEKKRIGSRNVKTAFYEKGLYSDDLEKRLNRDVETPGMKVFQKIYECEDVVQLTRDELETLKRYLLIQRYRNPSNIAHYDPDWEGDILHSNEKFRDSE